MKRSRTRILIAVIVAAGLAVGALLGVLASAIITNRDIADTANSAAMQSQQAVRQIKQESRGRRDQSCSLSEREHLEDIRTLRRAYRRTPKALEFYLQVAPRGFRPFLRNAVYADLARLEKEARVDRAPEFCDAPGIGLPEPDPVVPKRPPNLTPR